MKIDANAATAWHRPMHFDNFYAVPFEVFNQTMKESDVSYSIDMGGGVALHHGKRYGAPIWLMDNSCGSLYAVWYDKSLPN